MKYTAVIEYPEQTDEIIHEAFRQALSGKPGPVYIDIPMNTMQADCDLPPPQAPEDYRLLHQPAAASAIDQAVSLINRALRPILLVGQGAFTARAHQSLAALAETLQCPVIHTYPISSFLPGCEERTFPCGFSPAGSQAVSDSDLVIAIGTEIGEPVQHGVGGHWQKNDAQRKWIYIERDANAFGVNRKIHVPLLGDLRNVVPQLTAQISAKPRTSYVEELIAIHRQHKKDYLQKAPKDLTPHAPWALDDRRHPSHAQGCRVGSRRRRHQHLQPGPTPRSNPGIPFGTKTSVTWVPACPTHWAHSSPLTMTGEWF